MVQAHAGAEELNGEASTQEADQDSEQKLTHQIGHQHTSTNALSAHQCEGKTGQDHGHRVIEARFAFDQIHQRLWQTPLQGSRECNRDASVLATMAPIKVARHNLRKGCSTWAKSKPIPAVINAAVISTR